MKNIEQWRPTKFTSKHGRLKGSRNPSQLQVSSRLVADIVAAHYEKYLKLYAKGDLIDLGCGNVPLYGYYRDLVHTNVCVDWENTLHENPFIDKSCDLNESLPFNDFQFDTILLSDVLEHIRKPEQLWKEMERILRPGGNLILNVPFFYKIHEAPHDYYRYTEYTLCRFASENRLKVTVLEAMGGIPEIVSDLMAKLFYKIPFVGKALAGMTQQLCAMFLRTRPGKKISQKTARQFPLGYFMVVTKEIIS